MSNTMKINNRTVTLEGTEKNLLEVVSRLGIQLPTFCYHSELSVYGACRMCLVEDDKGALLAACSTLPVPGMSVRTHTPRLMKLRRTVIELLLANHHQDCTTCDKSGHCKLQQLANDLGVDRVRFAPRTKARELDESSPSVVRNTSKCILCGDCVRMCSEVQGVGVLGFAHRGPKITVGPAFEKPLAEVECVNCGQCAAVCPTGALLTHDDTAAVWQALNDPTKTVIAQLAPAVRVAIGEEFNQVESRDDTNRIVSALKLMGFDKVFDTCFTADLTVVEEANEFIARLQKSEKLPQFTSCCPGWITYAERNCPDLLPRLSSCRSPQQMFGSLAKKHYAGQRNIAPRDLVVVSIMPCTAKKFEARRPEFRTDGAPDVDHVLTTQELARMIRQMGIQYEKLEPEALDMPFGFFSGAAVIFGSSGGVAEAALRYAVEKVGGPLPEVEFRQVRGLEGIKEAAFTVKDTTLRLAVVSGLANAQKLIERVRSGAADYHLIEVMACPGGCIGGGGQPLPNDLEHRRERAGAIYRIDSGMPLKKSQDNPTVEQIYRDWLGEPNSPQAHQALHTRYEPRRRISGLEIADADIPASRLTVSVCIGTNCYQKGSYDLLQRLIAFSRQNQTDHRLTFKGTFCLENCACGPSIHVDADNRKYGVRPEQAEAFFRDTLLPLLDRRPSHSRPLNTGV